MNAAKPHFVIFAHSGTYDRLYQVSTMALTAAAMGKDVHIILFFWALKKLYSGKLDEPDFPAEYAAMSHDIHRILQEKKVPSISDMLQEARGIGVKIIVCSAGLEYMSIEKEKQPELVDDIWGLPKVLTLVGQAETTLYI